MHEAEKQALESLLSAGVLDRSPGLAAILRYVCAKYFEGRSDEVKEYSIAVEALGRGPDFDKRRDSIVRVEAHRLRKRLQAYYAAAGASEPVHIVLPEGSYVPVFVHRERERPSEAAPVPPAERSSRVQWILVLSALGLVLVIIAGLGWVRRDLTRAAGAPEGSEDHASPPAPATTLLAGREFRILAGRGPGAYNDRYGDTWEGDRFFSGGTAATTRHQEVRGMDRNYFTTMRTGDFQYDIPLEPGSYELQLIFAETELAADSGEGDRSFHVLANGKPLLTGFDPVYDAGGVNAATVKVFKDIVPAADGRLHLRFQSTPHGRAFVNALSVLPAIPGRIRPIRMVARKEPYRDPGGVLWMPDRFVQSGIVITRPTVPANHPRAELFRGERYGSFTYTIPVAQGGKYAVSLYLTEFWFGPSAPGGGGAGSRIFRVYCNHRLLLNDYDLFRDAGGSGAGVVKVFRNIEPNSKGKLVLDFEPVVNYALVNAIEVVDETPLSSRLSGSGGGQ